MSGGGEPGHVRSGLGNDHVSSQMADPGDGTNQVSESLKGFDQHLDPGGDLLDRAGASVDQVQVYPGQERVMIGEPAGQRLGQGGDLQTQPSLGQIGQRRRVVLAVDQPLEHQPTRDTHDVRGYRRQFDPGVLQHLLEPLDLATPFAGDRGPGPGQVT